MTIGFLFCSRNQSRVWAATGAQFTPIVDSCVVAAILPSLILPAARLVARFPPPSALTRGSHPNAPWQNQPAEVAAPWAKKSHSRSPAPVSMRQ